MSRRITLNVALVSAMAAGAWLAANHLTLEAQAPAQVPDFSGVYYPINAGGGGRGGAAAPRGGGAAAPAPAARGRGPLPAPTRAAPTSDGSAGRAPDAAKLRPEYMAKWEVIRKSRTSGSYEYDNTANCLPPGMPGMMAMVYGMEVMQARDRITFFSELNDAMRRVYIDGRKPTPAILDDPTYAGYSTGRWEGDTLVVETVALNDATFIEGFSPHSEEMTITERIRLVEPTLLEDQITVRDPKALLEPWSITRRYRKASPPNDQLREFACAEGLKREHSK